MKDEFLTSSAVNSAIALASVLALRDVLLETKEQKLKFNELIKTHLVEITKNLGLEGVSEKIQETIQSSL